MVLLGGFPRISPNIDRRIEPLLRLEILFDPLRRKFPSGLFREHYLDFSTSDVSDALLITLSSIEDVHIIKPTHVALEKEVAMNALADYSYHHPVVWDHLLVRAVDQGLFDEKSDDSVFTMETCLDLVKSYLRLIGMLLHLPAALCWRLQRFIKRTMLSAPFSHSSRHSIYIKGR